MTDLKDELFKTREPTAGSFQFNEDVAAVFNNMLTRSVPFYEEVLQLTVDVVTAELHKRLLLPAEQAQPLAVYDLGSSTGNFLCALAKVYMESCPRDLGNLAVGANGSSSNSNSRQRAVQLVGVDQAEAMTKRARAAAKPLTALAAQCSLNISFETAAVVDFMNAAPVELAVAAVVLQYTLQFIPVAGRAALLQQIYDALAPGGVILLSEKILAATEDEALLFHQQYESFKRRRGYAELEIARKRKALENVLIPLRLAALYKLLTATGFSAPVILFKWYNFTTLLARKAA